MPKITSTTLRNAICDGVSTRSWFIDFAAPLGLCGLEYLHFFHGLLSQLHLGWPSILIVDAYVLFLLSLAALRLPRLIPERQIAFVTVPVLFVTLIVAYAEIELRNGNFARALTDSSFEHLAPPPGQQIKGKHDAGQWNSAYFSLTTFTTVGYGDFIPQEGSARTIAMAEITNAVLFLLFAFPILGARLAAFPEPDTVTLRRFKGGVWEVRGPQGVPAIRVKGQRCEMRVEDFNGTMTITTELPSE